MVTEFLDVNGCKIPHDKIPFPAFEGFRRTSSNEIVARYVRCELPRVRGMIWVGHCLKCKFYGGIAVRGMHCKFDGKSAKNYIFNGTKCANKKKMQKK